jgi:katanin p60 ATPase-containing subunit A1
LHDAKISLVEALVLPMSISNYFKGILSRGNGVLMVGPSGTGKTMLAKAVATEACTTFFNVTPSTLASKYRGDSEKSVRLLFEMARFYAPSTIFIDQIDTLCSGRGSDLQHEATSRVQAGLRIHMDGLNCNNEDPAKRVAILAATNLAWKIDEAFLRRLKKRIYIPLPNKEEREAQLRMDLRELQLDSDVDLKDIAMKLEGYTGCDITLLCQESAMMPIRRKISNLPFDQIKQLREEVLDQCITAEDLKEALAKRKKCVSKEYLLKYEKWMRQNETD